jgi:phosphatidylserine/phosphatidylglycerophosphate/cardiolipin synthase-like enzyme
VNGAGAFVGIALAACTLCSCMPADRGLPDSPVWTGAAEVESPVLGPLDGSPAAIAAMRVLAANSEAWRTRWELLARAEHTIDLAAFIVSQDAFGMALLGHLLARAEAGVRVRLLTDGLGRAMARTPYGTDCLGALATPGALEVRVFRPRFSRLSDALRSLRPLVIAASAHDKILVVDGRAGIIGGRNVGTRYFADPADFPAAFSDTDVALEGEATTGALAAVFARIHDHAAPIPATSETQRARCRAEVGAAYAAMDAWLRGRPAARSPADAFPGRPWSDEVAAFTRIRDTLPRAASPPSISAPMRVLHSVPRPHGEGAVIRAIETAIANAAREVLLVTPYVVFPESFVEVLAAAGGRGVAITIVTNGPAASDNGLSQVFFREQWPRLLAHVPNVRVFVSGTRMLHGKLTIVDGRVGIVGSQNLDPLSTSVMGESALAIDSGAVADALAADARARLASGPPELYEYRIERDSAGRPLGAADGRPRVAFGPRDHADPDTWVRPSLLWRALGLFARPPFLPSRIF